jgi:TPR repeat protein
MAPAEMASLPCGHSFHCECVKQLRARGANDADGCLACPLCRASLPPGPAECFAEAARATARADRMRRSRSSPEQAHALCAQAAVLLEQVLQEEPGHMDALHQRGWCCDIQGEYEGATQWWQKAAMLGHAGAQFNLGLCYEGREGVCKDAGKAAEWYRKAAEQDDPDAQCNLGLCYANGEGVHKDMAKAAEWWCKAAELGHAGAQHNLGCCHQNREHVPKGVRKAPAWYQKAFSRGLVAGKICCV